MIRRLNHTKWGPHVSAAVADCAAELEGGAVLVLPELGFDVRLDEKIYFSPSIAMAKNVSFDPSSGRIAGAALSSVPEAGAEPLTAMVRRFSNGATSLVEALFPAYARRLERGRASFRPAEIAGRRTTWRHDDTRLHIDS